MQHWIATMNYTGRQGVQIANPLVITWPAVPPELQL